MMLSAPLAAAEPDLAKQVAAANHAFAVDLYGGMAGKNGNLIFSPISVSLALSMTWEGARGETEAQMSQVLHLPLLHGSPLEVERRRLLMGGLGGTKDYQLRVANKLWLQSGFPVEPAFLDATAKGYGAAAETLDFVRAAEPSRLKINSWVEAQTNGKIKELIPGGAIDPSTRLVLTNAIYFKGRWAKQFDKKDTKSEPFFTGGKQVRAPLMSADATFGYAASDGAQLVSLPYRGDALDMVVIVPDDKSGLAALEKQLARPGKLDSWLRQMSEQEVYLYLPRWKAEVTVGMSALLIQLGMKLAFDPRKADFSGIAGKGHEPPLYISAVFHKAFVEVNEEGTEAAAATGMVAAAADAMHQTPTVRADHPFIYLIRDRKSGLVLFMGRTVDPTAR